MLSRSEPRHRASAAAAALGAVALLLGACGGPTIHHGQRYADFPANYVTYATDTPYVATRVIGNPFGGSDAGLVDAVTAGMAMANQGYGLRYTTDPQVRTRRYVSMAVLFGGARTVGSGSLCSVDPELFSISDVRPIPVKMALCYGDRPLATLTGDLGEIVDPADPRFRSFVRLATEQLFESVPLPGGGAPSVAGGAGSPLG